MMPKKNSIKLEAVKNAPTTPSDFNTAVLKLLDSFTDAQQQINHVEIEGYTLTCTFRFGTRAYYEIWHGERYIYESASLLDALTRVFGDMRTRDK